MGAGDGVLVRDGATVGVAVTVGAVVRVWVGRRVGVGVDAGVFVGNLCAVAVGGSAVLVVVGETAVLVTCAICVGVGVTTAVRHADKVTITSRHTQSLDIAYIVHCL